MPLYLGLHAGAQQLSAVVIEIHRATRRIVFNRSIDFDRDRAESRQSSGSTDANQAPSPVMWADAIDRILGRLAAAAEIEVERIAAIAGAAHGDDGVLHQHLPDSKALDPSVALPAQLKAASPIARRFESLSAYFEALLAGPDLRLSPYWRKRFALPAAVVVPWSSDHAARAIGTGITRDGVIGVSFGTTDIVTAGATESATEPSSISFRNGARVRDLVRVEHGLEWADVARLLEQSPGNDGGVLLPWVERETTPPIAHAGIRRFGFDRYDAGRNVRGLIEGQLMAMANHVRVPNGAAVERVIVTGDGSASRAILQVTANVFGAEVDRLDTEQPAALGAALRAYHADRLAVGEPVSWKTVVSGFTDPKPGYRVSPDPAAVAIYAALRRDYAMLERLHQHRAPIC